MANQAEEYPAMSQSTTEIRVVPLATGQDVLTDLRGTGLDACWPGPSRPRSPPGSMATPTLWVTRDAARSSATATCPSGPSRPASGPSRSSSPGSVTAGPPTGGRPSTRPSCRRTSGRPGAWRGRCPGSSWRGSAPATSPRPSRRSSAPTPRGSRPPRSPGSRPPGRASSPPGASGRRPASVTSMSGPMGSTSISGWRAGGNASWCRWGRPPRGRRS